MLEGPIGYTDLVSDFSRMYKIPKRILLRRRFRHTNGSISNGFHPFEIIVENINEFLLDTDILPQKGNGDAVYLIKNDLIAMMDEKHAYKKVEEFVHALTATPLLSRKRHVQQQIPGSVLEDKEYLDRLVLLDYTQRCGKYPVLRNYLLLQAQVRCNCNDTRSKKLVELEDMPDERFFTVQHYLKDIAHATVQGAFDLRLYAFDARVNNY
jgi:hypothetical protein